eukprot:366319-Chlamydomonas_euryale.AAC.12
MPDVLVEGLGFRPVALWHSGLASPYPHAAPRLSPNPALHLQYFTREQPALYPPPPSPSFPNSKFPQPYLEEQLERFRLGCNFDSPQAVGVDGFRARVLMDAQLVRLRGDVQQVVQILCGAASR